MAKEYDIIKFSENGTQRVIKRGVLIEEARRICSNPETSSMTARKPLGCDGDTLQIERWHASQKHWFYGYREAR